MGPVSRLDIRTGSILIPSDSAAIIRSEDFSVKLTDGANLQWTLR
jgi:hypothetical protein